MSTPTDHTQTISSILYTHTKMQQLESVLEEKPWRDDLDKDLVAQKASLENTMLVPAIDTMREKVKDLDAKLKDWMRVVDVVVALQDDGPLKWEVAEAKKEMSDAVEGLGDTLHDLRKKLRIEGFGVRDRVVEK